MLSILSGKICGPGRDESHSHVRCKQPAPAGPQMCLATTALGQGVELGHFEEDVHFPGVELEQVMTRHAGEGC